MTTLSALSKYLKKTLDLQRTGGVLFTRDSQTLIMADKSTLSSQEIKLIQETFPHVSFAIISCEGSLSGFLVVFSCSIDGDTRWQRSLHLLLMHALCFVCAAHMTTVVFL